MPAGAAVSGYLRTSDALVPGPPWWSVTASVAVLPVALLSLVGLVLGIVGAARRERSGAPAITAMILALPGLGYAALAGYVALVVAACTSPAGSCIP